VRATSNRARTARELIEDGLEGRKHEPTDTLLGIALNALADFVPEKERETAEAA
jgi:hypothetical protein